jgi:hypothetical protein
MFWYCGIVVRGMKVTMALLPMTGKHVISMSKESLLGNDRISDDTTTAARQQTNNTTTMSYNIMDAPTEISSTMHTATEDLFSV